MHGFAWSKATVWFPLVGVLCLVVGSASVPIVAAQGEVSVPPQLQVPDGHVMFMQAEAAGVQIYTCQARADNPAAFEWTFRAPEAILMNSVGDRIGHHFAGPTWEGNDGSQVVGMAVAMAASPDPNSIPWLLLQARSNERSGVLSTVSYVQRLSTVGGQAPAAGCDSARLGEEARVDYTATYAFFYPAAM